MSCSYHGTITAEDHDSFNDINFCAIFLRGDTALPVLQDLPLFSVQPWVGKMEPPVRWWVLISLDRPQGLGRTTVRECRRKRQRDGRKEWREKVTRRMNVDEVRMTLAPKQRLRRQTGEEEEQEQEWGRGHARPDKQLRVTQGQVRGEEQITVFYSQRSKDGCTHRSVQWLTT